MFARTRTRIFGLLLLITVSLLLFGELARHPSIIYIFKPPATILILLVSLAQWHRYRAPYARYISIGLFFSFLGDLALIFPSRFFLLGLLFFLLAHIAYLVAFSRGLKFPTRPFIWLPYLTFGAALYAILFPNLPAELKIPVAFYALLLTSMAAQAMVRFIVFKNHPARSAAIGALLFMLSDSLLSLDRFHSSLPLAPAAILIPYYLAQWFIALSTIRAVATSPSTS